MSDDELERLINWYYDKGGSQMAAINEYICMLCLARNITTFLCSDCGNCPKHEGHSERCAYKK
jgi:hypothetical protein